MNASTTQSFATATSGTRQFQNASQPEPTASATPTHEEIAIRAYDNYLKSGSKHGHCKQNWQKAEQDLRNHSHATGAAQEAGSKSSDRHAGHGPVATTNAGGLSSSKK